MRRMHRAQMGVIALALTAIGGCTPAQDPAPPPASSSAGLTDPEEMIEARRVLMIEVERQMLPIDRFTLGQSADLAALKAAGTTLEALLLAFPHLFAPATDLFDPNVLEPPTRALPEIWRDFEAFLELGEAAESAAGAIAAANDAEALRAAGRSLRATCDGCHARFARPYIPPRATEEDLSFDFDPFLPEN